MLLLCSSVYRMKIQAASTYTEKIKLSQRLCERSESKGEGVGEEHFNQLSEVRNRIEQYQLYTHTLTLSHTHTFYLSLSFSRSIK